MKAITHTLIVLLALVCSLNVFSSNGGTVLNKAVVQKQIQSQLTVTVAKSEKVEVVFTTDKSGRVNLAIARTDDAELKRSIEKSFTGMRLSGLKAGNCYSVIVSIRLI